MAVHAKNLSRVWNKETVPAATTQRRKVSVERWPLGGLQWVYDGVVASDSATIAIYSSVLRFDDPDLADTDPATNPFWHLEDTAVFDSLPGNTEETEVLTLSVNAFGTLLIVVTSTPQLDDFSLMFRGQEY